MNFLGLDDGSSTYERARIALIPASYDRTCSWGKGAVRGPAAILEASAAAESYDEALDLDLEEVGFSVVPVPDLESLDPSAMVEAIHRLCRRVIRDGKIPAGLGGEHTVSLGFLRAVCEAHPGVSVLFVDAHSDFRHRYEGLQICHATVGRRILELSGLEVLVQAGLRSMSAEERRFIDAFREKPPRGPALHLFSAERILRDPGTAEAIADRLGERVYVTFDLDGLDPALLPHTGTPEPGGLSWRAACAILHAVGRKRRIVGFDVVELAPEEGSRASDFTAARLVMRLAGLAARPGGSVPGLPF